MIFRLLIIFLILEYTRPSFLPPVHLQALLLLLFTFSWLSDARSRPWSNILTAQLVFLALCAKAVPIASNNYWAYMTTRIMFGNVAIAVLMPWALSNRARLAQGIGWWLLILAYLAVWAITHGGRGPGGFLGDENDLAVACVTFIPFAFFGLELLKGERRWLLGLLGLLLVTAVVESFSRGGFVGLVAAAGYCLAASRHKLRSVSIAVFAIVSLFALAPEKYVAEIKTIRETSSGTAEGRLFLWATAYNMWKDHAVFGVGGGGFNWLAGEYQPRDWEERRFQERSWSGRTVHSAYFQILSELGLTGILTFGYLVWAYMRLLRQLRARARLEPGVPEWLRREIDFYALSLAGGMVGFLTTAVFLSVAYYPYAWYLAGLAVAVDVTMRRELDALPKS